MLRLCPLIIIPGSSLHSFKMAEKIFGALIWSHILCLTNEIRHCTRELNYIDTKELVFVHFWLFFSSRVLFFIVYPVSFLLFVWLNLPAIHFIIISFVIPFALILLKKQWIAVIDFNFFFLFQFARLIPSSCWHRDVVLRNFHNRNTTKQRNKTVTVGNWFSDWQRNSVFANTTYFLAF